MLAGFRVSRQKHACSIRTSTQLPGGHGPNIEPGSSPDNTHTQREAKRQSFDVDITLTVPLLLTPVTALEQVLARPGLASSLTKGKVYTRL